MFKAQERNGGTADLQVGAVGHREGRPDVHDSHPVLALRHDRQESDSGVVEDNFRLGNALHRDHAAHRRHQASEVPLLFRNMLVEAKHAGNNVNCVLICCESLGKVIN